MRIQIVMVARGMSTCAMMNGFATIVSAGLGMLGDFAISARAVSFLILPFSRQIEMDGLHAR